MFYFNEERLVSVKHALLHPFVTLYLPLPPLLRLRSAQEMSFAIERDVNEHHNIFSLSFHVEDVKRRSEGRRLRIGFVSADFSQKATLYLAAEHFKHFRRDIFEIFVYSVKDEPKR
jgi:predicted O-linked N-acetylglucosamine transferase (SPINDLY family)